MTVPMRSRKIHFPPTSKEVKYLFFAEPHVGFDIVLRRNFIREAPGLGTQFTEHRGKMLDGTTEGWKLCTDINCEPSRSILMTSLCCWSVLYLRAKAGMPSTKVYGCQTLKLSGNFSCHREICQHTHNLPHIPPSLLNLNR